MVVTSVALQRTWLKGRDAHRDRGPQSAAERPGAEGHRLRGGWALLGLRGQGLERSSMMIFGRCASIFTGFRRIFGAFRAILGGFGGFLDLEEA